MALLRVAAVPVLRNLVLGRHNTHPYLGMVSSLILGLVSAEELVVFPASAGGS